MLLQQHSSLHSLPSKGPFFSAGTRQFRLGCCAELGKGDHRGDQHILNIWENIRFPTSAFLHPRRSSGLWEQKVLEVSWSCFSKTETWVDRGLAPQPVTGAGVTADLHLAHVPSCSGCLSL